MTRNAIWLLLHGTPLTPAVWDGVRPVLAADRPVVTPLLPRPKSAVGAQTEIAERVLAGLSDRPLHVVGHSFGGQVALELAIVAPERLASLTILCSRASPFPAFAAAAESLRTADHLDVDASIQRWFLPDEVVEDGAVVRYARQCLVDADRACWADELDAIAAYDRRADLGAIDLPTMIIAADTDHVGTPEEMSAMSTAIPGARFELVTRASHMSQFIRPDVLAARLVAAAP